MPAGVPHGALLPHLPWAARTAKPCPSENFSVPFPDIGETAVYIMVQDKGRSNRDRQAEVQCEFTPDKPLAKTMKLAI